MPDLNFVTGDHYADEQDTYALLEKGLYSYVITKAEIRETNAKDGTYLNVTFQVTDGPRKKKCVFKKFNMSNPSQAAVQIGMRQLAGLTNALGIARLDRTEDLVGKEVQGETVIQAGNAGYDDSNDIKKFLNISETPETKTGDADQKLDSTGIPF